MRFLLTLVLSCILISPALADDPSPCFHGCSLDVGLLGPDGTQTVCPGDALTGTAKVTSYDVCAPITVTNVGIAVTHVTRSASSTLLMPPGVELGHFLDSTTMVFVGDVVDIDDAGTNITAVNTSVASSTVTGQPCSITFDDAVIVRDDCPGPPLSAAVRAVALEQACKHCKVRKDGRQVCRKCGVWK